MFHLTHKFAGMVKYNYKSFYGAHPTFPNKNRLPCKISDGNYFVLKSNPCKRKSILTLDVQCSLAQGAGIHVHSKSFNLQWKGREQKGREEIGDGKEWKATEGDGKEWKATEGDGKEWKRQGREEIGKRQGREGRWKRREGKGLGDERESRGNRWTGMEEINWMKSLDIINKALHTPWNDFSRPLPT